jgi:predicted phosphoribosyltransferase
VVAAEYDRVVGLLQEAPLIVVECWYATFGRVSDGEVRAALEEARRDADERARCLWDEEWFDEAAPEEAARSARS